MNQRVREIVTELMELAAKGELSISIERGLKESARDGYMHRESNGSWRVTIESIPGYFNEPLQQFTKNGRTYLRAWNDRDGEHWIDITSNGDSTAAR